MTIAWISEVVHGWLGWCPDTHGRPHATTAPMDVIANTPPRRGSFKSRALSWLGLFRNQLLVGALYFSAVGVLFSVFTGGTDLRMILVGVVAGSILSVFQGIRFWKTMNEVRDEGAVLLVSLYDKTTITIALIAFMVPVIISLGAIPGLGMAAVNSATGGFIFIVFWWSLLVTWIWESREKRHLLSDGLMLSLAREPDHVSC